MTSDPYSHHYPAPDERHPLLNRPVSVEAATVAMICLLDLTTTLYWVSQGQAREGNPVLAYFLQLGSWHFIIAKLVTFVPALVIAEWYRPRNPRLVIKALRWVIVFYLFIYTVGVLGHYGRVLDFYRSLLG